MDLCGIDEHRNGTPTNHQRDGVFRQAGPGHRLGPRDSHRVPRVEEERPTRSLVAIPCRRAADRMVFVTLILAHTLPNLCGKIGAPRRWAKYPIRMGAGTFNEIDRKVRGNPKRIETC